MDLSGTTRTAAERGSGKGTPASQKLIISMAGIRRWRSYNTLRTQLNALDKKRGKYMTVSELKSVVFSMTQVFSSAVPVEEQLRLMAQSDQTSPDLKRLTEMHLEQLSAHYALLKQKTPE